MDQDTELILSSEILKGEISLLDDFLLEFLFVLFLFL
jgi:hypothetical protein